MNLYSMVAIVAASFFGMMIYERARNSRMDKQNLCALLVLATLAWWSACDAFFFVADTKEAAWFWHRLGAPGWCGFAAVTAYYFLIMTGADEKMPFPVRAVFWLPPLMLTTYCMAGGGPTVFAEDLILSGSGLGWTYSQSYGTIWPFLYFAYLLAYMGGALLCLGRWRKTVPSRSDQALAKGFVILDCIAVGVGVLSVFVITPVSSWMPPASCFAVLIFGTGYWYQLRKMDFLYIEQALNSGYIFENCIGALVVTDERFSILYANSEAKRLLGAPEPGRRSFFAFFTEESRRKLSGILASSCEKVPELELQLESGVPVLCSFNRTRTRLRNYRVCVMYLHDISQLRAAMNRLDYLAHFDELTGLYNRRRMRLELELWAEEHKKSRQDFGLLFLDLTGFKQINDTFGHAAGDMALKAAADALRASVDPQDIVARFAGDEFVILRRAGGEEAVKEKIHAALRAVDCESFAPGFQMDAGIGSCLYSEAGDLTTLLKIADSRMYENKERSRR